MKKILLSCIALLVLVLSSCAGQNGNYTDFEKNISSVVEEVSKSVVGVVSTDGLNNFLSIGSGVIYKKENNTYFVITNYHVIRSHMKINVYYSEYDFIESHVYAYDEAEDLAIVTFQSSLSFRVQTKNPITSKAVKFKKGNFCIAIGSPLNIENFNTVTFGIISNVYFDVIGHDASLNPGNSGGALFNTLGELIGINTSKIFDTMQEGRMVAVEGMGFAINLNNKKDIIRDMYDGSYNFTELKLGLSLTALSYAKIQNPEIEEYIDSSLKGGLVVYGVDMTRPCANKIEVFDVITSVRSTVINDLEYFSAAVGTLYVGKVIDLVVSRKVNGVFVSLDITITI
ncbi:MAG: trypsin-like peptidase domain-containing protein [Acholeplasmatales bacterium]|jgi:serine protease Do|nr:trypsin-like peptidase domain-containing protein [Acholeplasmatales bacterium]